MGSSTSKAAQTASKVAASTAPKAARRYPTRTPPAPTATPQQRTPGASTSTDSAKLGPTVHPDTLATDRKDAVVERDASDPDLALNARLRQLGPAIPNPTYSPSSTAQSTSQTTSSIPSPSQQSTLSRPNPNHDPSTSPQTFIPSASNPSQSIFPTAPSPGSNASTNPAVSLLTARYRLAEEAEKEFEDVGREGVEGRRFLDVVTLRQVVGMRERGMSDGEIERDMRLREGTVEKLGRRGLVGVARS